MFNQTTRPIIGEIVKKNNDSFVVKLRDGSTKIVFLTDKTLITKSTKASLNDLKERDNVFVVG